MAQPASFTPLGDLSGGSFLSRARALSGDGTVAAGGGTGASGTEGVRWVGASAAAGLGNLAGGGLGSEGYAISGDGSVVFGNVTDSVGNSLPARWTSAGWMPLGFLATGGYSGRAFACSADGLAACGEQLYQPPSGGGPPPFPITQAFRWTMSGGMEPLGVPPGISGTTPGSLCTARAMSADGSVVVGYASDVGPYRPWRWTHATGMVDLSNGTLNARSLGCSSDGSVVVGGILSGEPFVWTSAGGLRTLGLLPGYTSGAGTDVSIDGGRILGILVGSPNAAAVWDRALGGGGSWQTVQTALSAAGVSTAGWTLSQATAMTDDGRTIVGYGTDPSGNTEAWKAVLPRPCLVDFDGMGGVGVPDIFEFLNAWFAGDPRADYNGVDGITVQDIFDFLNAWFVGC
jgi:uncharacterized membrane protein